MRDFQANATILCQVTAEVLEAKNCFYAATLKVEMTGHHITAHSHDLCFLEAHLQAPFAEHSISCFQGNLHLFGGWCYYGHIICKQN